jgi:hypothetical protein
MNRYGEYGYGTIFRCSTSGAYTTLINLTDNNGAFPQNGSLLEVKNITSGITKIVNKSKFMLYPNPATNMVNLSFDNQATEQAEIQIFNIIGKEVISENATVGNGKVVSINVEMLSPGMYFVKVITNNNMYVEKFIKM